MKVKINQCVEFLKMASLEEPKDIRVEEVSDLEITLSYVEYNDYNWQSKRIYKAFFLKEVEGTFWVDSMKNK